MRRTRLLGLGLFVVLSAALARAEERDLAGRCEAVPWTLPKPVDGVILDPVPEGLKAIREELRKRGPSAMDEIERSLDRSLHLRRIASDVVSNWPCDRSRAVLLRLLKDPDEATAAAGAFGLGMVGGAEVIDGLVKALGDPRARVRHDALNSLGGIGGANRGLDAAAACLDAKEPWVRHSAATMLSVADYGVEKALPALERMAAGESDAEAKAAADRSLAICRARLGR
jgi:HEAT repeat protein